MASWQAKLYVVPPSPEQGGWETWAGLSLLRTELDRLFQTPETTDFLGAQYWGNDKRHDARLWLDEPEQMLAIRIDLREPVTPILQALSRVLTKCGLSLKDGDKTLEPSEKNLVRVVGASKAARFIADPGSYMDELEGSEESGV